MIELWEWERGIAVESRQQKGMTLYFWFYEWNMFDAIQEGEHTHGHHDFARQINADQNEAIIQSSGLSVGMKATDDGADMVLTVTNESEHDWPQVAGIIPCFNPGPPQKQNPQFIDGEHKRTYFLGDKGLELLEQREIHFNQKLRAEVDSLSQDDRFVFSEKWPTSNRDALAGILIRESIDGKWVAGIAWENFLSSQGHNPWNCMHLSVQVGPLKPSESKTIKGKIYLFRGKKEDCLEKFRTDFPRIY